MRTISQQRVGRTGAALGWPSRITGLTGVLGGILFFTPLHNPAFAATWYVDNSLASSGNGQSWATAWTGLPTSGVSAGDTVYISGGPWSQTYNTTGWSAPGGSAGNPVYYKVGTDPAHNGVVIINGSGTWNFFQPKNYVDINGDVNCAQHLILTNANAANLSAPTSIMNESSGVVSGQCFRYMEFYGGLLIADCSGGVEFDHCKWDPVNWVNRALFLQGDGSQNSATEGFVHDCEIWVVRDVGSAYTGDDGIAGGNITISNCIIGTVPIAANSYVGQGSQHQDLIQGAYGQIHAFNSWFLDSDQYGFYGEYRYQGGSYWVINCVFVNCAVYAVAIGPDSANFTLPDNIVANNLCIDGGGLGVNNGAPYSGINYSGSIVENNISVNTTLTDLSGTGLSLADNLNSFPTSGFVSYTKGAGTNNNFHLNSTATTAIGQAMNLSSNFTFDKDGNTRAASGAWDIGPYEFVTGSTYSTISVSPGSLNFGPVQAGTTSNLNFIVRNVGNGTLSGTASVQGAPFSIVSGGNYSLGANQSQTVTVVFSPTVASNYTQNVSFSGGSGTNATVSGSVPTILPKVQFRVTPIRQFILTVTGPVGHTYDIQATQDFITWTVIGTVTVGASGSVDFTDTNAAGFSRRFYRTRG